MALPDYTAFYMDAGVSGWDTLYNSVLDLLEAQKGVEYAETTLTALAGATVTWANAFPAGVRQIGVTGRVTTLITASGGGVTLNVGDHGSADPDRYAGAIAFAATTTFADVATADPGGWNATARDVVISPDAGAFTAGEVKLRAYFVRTTTPAA